MSYTKEPWPEYIDVAVVMTPDPNGPDSAVLSFEDYQRARACVNALANVSTEWLESNKAIVVLGAPIADRFKELEKQNAELLDACKKALYALKGREHDQFLRDAIANAEQNP